MSEGNKSSSGGRKEREAMSGPIVFEQGKKKRTWTRSIDEKRPPENRDQDLVLSGSCTCRKKRT